MKKRKENQPIDWNAIEKDFRAGVMSIREIARWYGLTHTAINRKAKQAGWEREEKSAVAPEVNAPKTAEIIPPADPEDVTDRARGLAGRLMDELDAVTTHAGELGDLICAEEGDPRRRQALLKAISLPERAKTLKDISTVLKTLKDASEEPQGKKAQRQAAAESAASGGGKFAPRTRPRLVSNNG